MRAKKLAEEYGVGFGISYESEENCLSLVSGTIYGEGQAQSVREPEAGKYKSDRFIGNLSIEDGEFSFVSNPDWDPEEPIPQESILIVEEPKRMKFTMLPDHQPTDRPLSLFVDDELVAQGREVEWSSKSNPNVRTGILGVPRILPTLLDVDVPLKSLAEEMGADKSE